MERCLTRKRTTVGKVQLFISWAEEQFNDHNRKLDSKRNCGIDLGQCPSSNSSKESKPQALQEQIDLAWRGVLKNQEKETHGPWAVPVPSPPSSQHLFFNNAVISVRG